MKAMEFLWRVLFITIRIIVRSMLKFDSYILKRYFNIETPLYKFWWNNHTKVMQRKLNKYYKTISKQHNYVYN